MKLFRKVAVVTAVAGVALAVPTSAMAARRGYHAPAPTHTVTCTWGNQSQSVGNQNGLVNLGNLGLNGGVLNGVGLGLLGQGVGTNPVRCS